MGNLITTFSSVEAYVNSCSNNYSAILTRATEILSQVEKLLYAVQTDSEGLSQQIMRGKQILDEIQLKVEKYKALMEEAAAEMDRCNAEINYILSHPITKTYTDEDGNDYTVEEIDEAALAAAERALEQAQALYDQYRAKYEEAAAVMYEVRVTVSRFEQIKNGIDAVEQSIQADIYEIKKYINAIKNESEYNLTTIQGALDSIGAYLASKPIYVPVGTTFSDYSRSDSASTYGGGVSSLNVGVDSADSVDSKGGILSKIFGKKNSVEKSLKGVEHRPIKNASAERTEEQIIGELSGGDMTEGSCSSLAFAYAGNKAGYVVYDFRDGQSRSVFSSRDTIKHIATLDGVKSKIEVGTNDGVCAERLMSEMESGKEYYMVTGRHAAVVRLKSDVGYQYLELQSEIPSDNGWQPLTQRALYERFGCDDRHKTEWSNYLIQIDSLKSNTEFLNLLGYINTDKSAQVKGESGHVR